MTRREFLGFFILGGFLSIFFKKIKSEEKSKKAMFWRKKDEV